MASPKNFYKSLTLFRVCKSNTPFTFFSSILISSSLITTSKNPTFLIFYLYFSGFTYKSFSTNLFTTFSIASSCLFFFVPTMISSMRLTTSLVLIKSCKISFIIVWNIAGRLVSPKNITIGLNSPSGVMNTFFVLIFSTISKIKSRG